MSTKPILKGLTTLLLSLVFGGCITTQVEITLNPDGSGTLEYTTDFDRAPEEMRENIRQQRSDPYFAKNTAKETILENYPEPHFKLLSHEDDKETLKTRIVLHFNDINTLLIKRDTADLGLKALDFAVDGDTLVFSVKEEKLTQPWPEQFDETPGMETITIVNAKSGEKLTFSRELTSKTKLADWTGRLRFPRRLLFFGGHQIVRTPNIQVFHDYPVVQTAACDISGAQWTLRNHKQWSFLELKLSVSLPENGYSYTRWDNPVALTGEFLPKQEGQSGQLKLNGQGDFSQTHSGTLLKLPVPNGPVETLDSLKVRLRAYRASSSKIVDLGPLKPNTEYTVDDLTFQIDGLANNCLGFKATGTADRLKDVWLETRRGNRFKLKWSSNSSLPDKKTMKYRAFLPLEGCSLCAELYNSVEPCYIDMNIPSLDLTQRAWKSDEDKSKNEIPSNDWKLALKAEHPELFDVSVPPVETAMFEDKKQYKAYFQGLEDQQIMPAIVEVVDYMIRHKPKHADMWIQSYAQDELKERSEFLGNYREIIANQLIGIYKHTPKRMGCIAVFFPNLNLKDLSQPVALSEIRNGNLRFAENCLFGDKKLAETDIAVLMNAVLNSSDWTKQTALLKILNQTDSANLSFAMQVFNNRALSPHVRKAALEIALKNKGIDSGLATKAALDTTEKDSFVRTAALPFLMKQDPCPINTFRRCLTDLDISRSTASALKSHIATIQRSTQTLPAMRKQWIETLQPLIPILEDLAEQLTEHDAKEAIAALEQIRKLEASAEQE